MVLTHIFCDKYSGLLQRGYLLTINNTSSELTIKQKEIHHKKSLNVVRRPVKVAYDFIIKTIFPVHSNDAVLILFIIEDIKKSQNVIYVRTIII